MPIYGIDAYDWNSNPIGGGSGYLPQLPGISTVSDYPGLLSDLAPVQPNLIIIKNTAEIDIKDNTLDIPANKILRSHRGDWSSEGALLYSSTQNGNEIFRITGPNVQITGIRFGGYDLANPDYTSADSACAISCDQPGLIVENCEFYGFSKIAISINGSSFGSQLSPITIHHCYIHHNYYGIYLNNCSVEVYANIFDYNTHAIYSSIVKVTTFKAYYNLVLSNAKGSDFDMHCGIGTSYVSFYIIIHHNSFWLLSHAAILIGGKPAVSANIYNNRFAETD